jgi:hypothetical protein
LFDAVEVLLFRMNNMEGRGSCIDIKEKQRAKGKKAELIEFLEF